MAVVIQDFEILPEPTVPPPAPAVPDAGGEPEPDLRALQALLAREAWREERLQAD